MDTPNEHYDNGKKLKAEGNIEAALTEFRRAAIADPKFFEAQFEIGLICRDKSRLEKIFERYAFEAFRNAARLNLNHEDAHTHYIMAGQKMGLLDELHLEYVDLCKKYPDNAMLQKCNKNIVTVSMALMPQQSSAGTDNNPVRKAILIGSVVSLLLGLILMVAGPMLLKSGKIQKNQMANLVRGGFLLEAVGVAGFIIRTKVN